MKQNFILRQLRLLFRRFVLGSPKGFKIFTNIMLAISVITGLPEFLEMLDIQLPPQLQIFANKLIAFASGVAAFVAKLTVEDVALLLNKSSNQNSQENETP